jgi:hypothetical protein
MHWVRGELRRADELAEELLRMVQSYSARGPSAAGVVRRTQYSLMSQEAELKKYGFQVPVLVVSAPATKHEATITLPDGTTRKVYV